MSLPIIVKEKIYSKETSAQPLFFGHRGLHFLFLLSLFFLVSTIRFEIRALEIDWSKRSSSSSRSPASDALRLGAPPSNEPVKWADEVLQGPRIETDLVIIHTESGFIPSQLVLNTKQAFNLYIVNTHPFKKTSSFQIEGFGVSGEMPFSKEKKITLKPKKAGLYTLVSLESNYQVRLIVLDVLKNASQ